MRGNDYYDLLGVTRDATPTEIRSAYRALAKRLHPDTGGTAGTFRLLREAYETLSDPDLRDDYDNGSYDNDDSDTDSYDGSHDGSYATGHAARPRRETPDFEPGLPTIDTATIPWWHDLRGDRPITLLPTTRPPRDTVLATAAGWTVVLLVLVLTGVPLPITALWTLAGLAAATHLTRRHLTARDTDRAFTAEHGTRHTIGRPGGEPDETGERLTAELLDTYLTRIPGARVYHGLAADRGGVFADIHHAVLCGRRLLLVDTKLWLPGHYRLDDTDTLWRNGHRFRGGTTALREHVRAYQALLPDLEVRGALLIYPSRRGEVTVDDQPAPVTPTTPARFVRELGAWLATEQSRVDREAVRTLAGQVVTDT